MKTPALILSACLLIGFTPLKAQDMFKSNNGKVKFFSKAPLEDIEAATSTASSIIRVTTGEVAFSIPIRSFKFAKALMEEHFNENYLESEKYPQATFTGKIVEKVDLQSQAEQNVTVDGTLTVHGVAQKRQIPATIRLENGKLKGHSQFKVKLVDHQIDIPHLVFHKIAEVIDVTLDFDYASQVN